MENVERAIEISSRIKELRSELDELTSELEEMLLPPARAARRRAAVSNGHGRTIDDRILEVLISSKNLLNASQIQEEMPDVELGSIRAALSRMLTQELIVRPERGWYSENPRPPKPEEPEPQE